MASERLPAHIGDQDEQDNMERVSLGASSLDRISEGRSEIPSDEPEDMMTPSPRSQTRDLIDTNNPSRDGPYVSVQPHQDHIKQNTESVENPIAVSSHPLITRNEQSNDYVNHSHDHPLPSDIPREQEERPAHISASTSTASSILADMVMHHSLVDVQLNHGESRSHYKKRISGERLSRDQGKGEGESGDRLGIDELMKGGLGQSLVALTDEQIGLVKRRRPEPQQSPEEESLPSPRPKLPSVAVKPTMYVTLYLHELILLTLLDIIP